MKKITYMIFIGVAVCCISLNVFAQSQGKWVKYWDSSQNREVRCYVPYENARCQPERSDEQQRQREVETDYEVGISRRTGRIYGSYRRSTRKVTIESSTNDTTYRPNIRISPSSRVLRQRNRPLYSGW